MLLVQQSNGGSEVKLTGHHRHAAAHAIERISVAHQDTQRSFGSGGRNFDENLADYAFPTIRSQNGFNCDFIARSSFRQIRPRALQTRLATLFHEIEIQLHRCYGWYIERIVIDAAKSVAEGKGRQKCRGLARIGWSEHVLQLDLGI